MEETRWKTSENNWKIDENCWKNNEKEGTQPRIPPKKMQKKNANLIPRPIYIYYVYTYYIYVYLCRLDFPGMLTTGFNDSLCRDMF